MLRMNTKMRQKLQLIAENRIALPLDLVHIVDAGFCDQEGCTLLACLTNMKTGLSLDDFPDKTGYECFINSLHIDDYTDSNYLLTACKFADEALNSWKTRGAPEVMQAIVSSEDVGAVVKFHIARDGEPWISGNLEGFEDAVLLIDSSDGSLLDRLFN